MRLTNLVVVVAAAPLFGGCALVAGLEERHGPVEGPSGPVALAESQVVPRMLAVDDTHVYWGNEGKDGEDTAIRRIPKSGGAVVTIALPGAHTPQAIAVDVADIYWVDLPVGGCSSGNNERVMRAPKDSVVAAGGGGGGAGAGGGGGGGGGGGAGGGGDGEPLWQECSKKPRAIALDGANVYFTRWDDGDVTRIDKATGDEQKLANAQARPFGIAVDGESVYWVNYDDGSDEKDRVVLRDKALGTVMEFAVTAGNPRWIALDEESVYWLTELGDIWRLPKAKAGGVPQKLANGLDAPGGLALDDMYAYATASGAGTVVKVRKDGTGDLVVVASEQDYPAGVAVDAVSVYWTNANGGQIMAVRKP